MSGPVRPITGTWIDFHHPNPREGDYWNDVTRAFTADDWALKVGEIAALGMDTIVILSVALRGAAFYPSRVIPRRWDLVCPDPIEAVLAAADRHGLSVYIGVGYFGAHTGAVAADDVDRHLRHAVPAELAERYGGHPSFRGWYLPVEAGITGHFADEYLEYARNLADRCRSLAPQSKVLLAPYGTRTVVPDERYVEQLRALGVDYIAYQCEVGVRKTRPDELPGIFANLRRAHDAAGVPLWVDLEIFTFEGETYRSPLLPAPFERIRQQLEAVSPYVEKVLCYQYLGMMNPPGSPVFAGHPSSSRLYEAYTAWLRSLA